MKQTPHRKVAVVLLAGGSGKRMGASKPKQFLELRGEPVLSHGLRRMLEVGKRERERDRERERERDTQATSRPHTPLSHTHPSHTHP